MFKTEFLVQLAEQTFLFKEFEHIVSKTDLGWPQDLHWA